MSATETLSLPKVLPVLHAPEHAAIFHAGDLDNMRHAASGLMFLTRMSYALLIEGGERDEGVSQTDRGALYSAMRGGKRK